MKTIIKILIPVCIVIFILFERESTLTQMKQAYRNMYPVLKLQLIAIHGIKQLDSDSKEQFDLSGMLFYNGMILAVADKEWNRSIYRIHDKGKTFSYDPYTELCPGFSLDLEGIEFSENGFYLIDETTSDVYEVTGKSCEMHKLSIPWDRYNIDKSAWGNKGFEGIAYDGKNLLLYLAKEREPARIFCVDLKKMIISEPFTEFLSSVKETDISELKYEKGYLYMLERKEGLITRINIKTGDIISASFLDYEYKNGQRLYKNKNPQYGMAESFIFKDNEIWIGLDNNGNNVSEYGKSMGLNEGNKTAILVFKRPGGF